jgi:putative integral membrane protein (TIGR02587 family)
MPATRTSAPATPQAFARGLARAFAGALIFGLPVLMSAELWELGARLDRLRLALLVLLVIPLRVGVAHRVGFEPSFGWREDLRDAAIALLVGMLASVTILLLFDQLGEPVRPDQVVGRVAIQAVPTALGALLARSQLRGSGGETEGERAFGGYLGTLFMMLVGALFLSFNMAPTEEMVLVAFAMTPWHALGLVALSLGLTHAFVRAHANRRGPARTPAWSDFLRYSLPGYALALAISLLTLWLLGSLDGFGISVALMATVVLAFPAALGASAARMIL